ncbi:hypothetical protein PMG11_08699 [Penicillium brasilianum]|uniref:BZIP domain-containing protein n=1 Tax=Penicillium brasilianum TaxID=104259 RepID=A0A0F7TTM3_PENBI|nr:hypothetical protein PMG11_08699 [Penicillium brasilianum]
MARQPATKVPVPPTLGEDAAERKRVLNILAQRRYRKRKKERLQALESRAKSSVLPGDTVVSNQQEGQSSGTPSEAGNLAHEAPRHLSAESNFISSSDTHFAGVADLDFNYMDPSMNLGLNDDETGNMLYTTLWPKSQSLTSLSLPTSEILQSDISFALPATTAGDTFWGQLAGSSDWNLESHDLVNVENHLAESLPLNMDGTYDLSAELQADDTSFFTFPDDRILQVPSLTLLNAAMKVAQRLNINGLIWDFTAVSPFYSPASSSSSIPSPPSLQSGPSTSVASPTSSVDLTELPLHLLPTRTQRLIPHHPIIDLLPWPSTRDKLIQVFQLPVNLRPPTAQDPMGLVRLVYDMEDEGGEGVRINGDDPFEPSVWEIGQVVFERWWWAFEISVVERSNRARGNRGEKILLLEGQNS